MEIADVARDDTTKYAFGMDAAKTVAALRKLADQIECKDVIVQKAKVLSTAQNDAFAFETLRLTYAVKNQSKAES